MTSQPPPPDFYPVTSSAVPVVIHRSDYAVYLSLTGDTCLANLATRFGDAYRLFLQTMRCYDSGGQVMLYGKSSGYWWNNLHPEPQFFEASRKSIDYHIVYYAMPLPEDDELMEIETYLDILGLRNPYDATLTIMTFYLKHWHTGRRERADLFACYPSQAQKSQHLPESVYPFILYDSVVEPINDAGEERAQGKSQLFDWHTHLLTPAGSRTLMHCTP